LARRRKSKRALSRRKRAVLVALSLIGTAFLIWLDREVVSPQWSAPSSTRGQALATDLSRYHGQRFRVVRVVDGDTLHLWAADGADAMTKVRLLGIDAPEMGGSRGERMYFAEQATALARRLALDREVRIYLDERAGSRDRYQRLLAYVELPGGNFLNEELLTQGCVYTDRRFRHGYYQKYLQLEAAARAAGQGLWKNVTPEQMPPWLQKMQSDATKRGQDARDSIIHNPSSILQVVLPDLAVERSLADAEDLGGLFAVALRPGQGVGDGLFFQIVQGDAGQAGRRGAGARQLPARGNLGRQIRNIDLGPVAHHDHRPDRILELTDVARPFVGGEDAQGRLRDARDL
jgi:micrococcal nuclease